MGYAQDYQQMAEAYFSVLAERGLIAATTHLRDMWEHSYISHPELLWWVGEHAWANFSKVRRRRAVQGATCR